MPANDKFLLLHNSFPNCKLAYKDIVNTIVKKADLFLLSEHLLDNEGDSFDPCFRFEALWEHGSLQTLRKFHRRLARRHMWKDADTVHLLEVNLDDVGHG